MVAELFERSFQAWEILAFFGLCFIVIEVFVASFYLLPIGLSFLMTAGFAVILDSWVSLFFVFSLSLILVYIAFDSLIRSKLYSKSQYKSNASGMIGKKCTVIEPISIQQQGYVKLYGDEWKALTNQEEENFKVGDEVIIQSMDGNKVIIGPIQNTIQ